MAVRCWMEQSLVGGAARWHEFHVGEGVDLSTADRFYPHLMEEYAPDYFPQLAKDFATCTQHPQELLTDFIARVSQFIAELHPEYSSWEKVEATLSRMNSKYQMEMRNKNCKHMAQLMAIACRTQNDILKSEANDLSPPQQSYAEPQYAFVPTHSQTVVRMTAPAQNGWDQRGRDSQPRSSFNGGQRSDRSRSRSRDQNQGPSRFNDGFQHRGNRDYSRDRYQRDTGSNGGDRQQMPRSRDTQDIGSSHDYRSHDAQQAQQSARSHSPARPAQSSPEQLGHLTNNSRPRSQSPAAPRPTTPSESRCYTCHGLGHFARDCVASQRPGTDTATVPKN
jgi:hypothetical protein